MLKIKQLTSIITKQTLNYHCVRYKSANEYLSRQNKIMNKLIFGKKPNKKIIYDNMQRHTAKPSTLATTKRQNTAARRITVLNKLFMKYVTDLMANHSLIGERIAGCSVEVTGVKVCQQFHGLHVYWLGSTDNDDKLVEQRLASIAGPLRHELSQLRLMGEIPRITFIKDRTYALVKEVNERLLIADFGEDYDPTGGRNARKEFQTEYEAEDILNSTSDIESTLPPMRHDVMGVDHKAIMSRIKGSMNKTRKAWQIYEGECLDNSNPEIDMMAGERNSIPTLGALQEGVKRQNENEAALKEFLRKRALEKKVRKQLEYDARDYLSDVRDDEDEEDIYDEQDICNEEYDSRYEEFEDFYSNEDYEEK